MLDDAQCCTSKLIVGRVNRPHRPPHRNHRSRAGDCRLRGELTIGFVFIQADALALNR